MTKKTKRIILIISIILIVLAVVGGLLYRKFERISRSLIDSAKKAGSQNTPLMDE